VTRPVRAIDRTGPDLEDITQLRRELGRDLAAQRKAAGMLQEELAGKIGHTRGSLSNAETGNRDKSRKFWQACDDVLGTGTHFADSYDRIYAGHEPAPSPKATATPALRLSAALKSSRDLAGTLAEYRLLGWPVRPGPHGALALPTGEAADAFEVPRAVDVIVARSWLETRGKGRPSARPPGTALPDDAPSGNRRRLPLVLPRPPRLQPLAGTRPAAGRLGITRRRTGKEPASR
jgi:DNA-binding XRE family transcriptional regulator